MTKDQMELLNLKELSKDLKIKLLKTLGLDVDEQGVYVMNEGRRLIDKYIGKPVQLDNMAIFPGDYKQKIATVVIDDNDMSVTSYLRERENALNPHPLSYRPGPNYFDKEYYMRMPDYEDRAVQYRERAFWIKETFKPQRVLEIGAGEGTLSGVLNNELSIDTVSLDISLYGAMFEKAGSRIRVLADDSSLPFKDNVFDLVFGFDILEHNMEKYVPSVIRECARVSSRNAYFNVALEGTTDTLVDATHFTLYPRKWWEDLFTQYFDITGNGDCPTLNLVDAQFTLQKK